jgi:hypothetical protein
MTLNAGGETSFRHLFLMIMITINPNVIVVHVFLSIRAMPMGRVQVYTIDIYMS